MGIKGWPLSGILLLTLPLWPAYTLDGIPDPTSAVHKPDPLGQARLAEAYAKLPMGFELNVGQTDGSVRFICRNRGSVLFLAPGQSEISFDSNEGRETYLTRALGNVSPSPARSSLGQASGYESAKPGRRERAVLKLKLLGRNPASRLVGLEELPGRVNYFIGDDPGLWHTNIPTYARVKYENVYHGIDLIYHGDNGQLEYDFVVAPGADPSSIRLNYEGAIDLGLEDEGDLLIGTTAGTIHQRKPRVYHLDPA